MREEKIKCELSLPIDMYTGEVTEARRDDILKGKKAFEKPKLKIGLTMETCEDRSKKEKIFASLDELQEF